MSWMREPQWRWYILFTDAFASLCPLKPVVRMADKEVDFGSSQEDLSQGPPAVENKTFGLCSTHNYF